MKRRIDLALVLVACGPATAIPSDDSSTTGSSDSAATAETTGSTTTTTTTTTTVDSSAGDPSTTIDPDTGGSVDDDGSGFIEPSSGGGGENFECDLWIDDCPRGQKCMPREDENGNPWNAWKCSPLADDPKAVGEACTVEGSRVSGIDDCGLHSMCWYVDPETLMGECVAFCSGSEANPTCEDPCTSCSLSSAGILNLCLPTCDPLAQNCFEGSACYPDDDTFACAPDASEENGALGDPCEFINVCDPGLFCALEGYVPEAFLPDCGGAPGCCMPFCDATAAQPCPQPGFETAECIPWFDEGEAPPCFSGVIGACVPPE